MESKNECFIKTSNTSKNSYGKLKFKSEEIENGTQSYLVYFKDLEISFIDSKGNAYFRAKDYEIEEDKNDDFK